MSCAGSQLFIRTASGSERPQASHNICLNAQFINHAFLGAFSSAIAPEEGCKFLGLFKT